MKLLIKIGGTLLDQPSSRQALAGQIAAAHKAEHQCTVVHGGGRQLTRFLEGQGVATRFVDGLRVTTDQAIDAVIQILAGLVNKRLVAALRAAGANPVGISGLDGRLTTAIQLNPELGWVGKIVTADAAILNALTASGSIPVVACISGDDQGGVWNVNADQMAAACARAFHADQLIFLTDVAGVLDGEGHIIPTLNARDARHLIETGVAKGGMQAKLEAAVAGGAPSVAIAPGAEPDVLLRLLAGEPLGTEITHA